MGRLIARLLRAVFRKPPTQAQRQRWDQVRAKGKKRFVIRTGVIGWGGFMFVLMTLLPVVEKKPHQLVLFDVILGLLIWPLAGYWFGVSMWSFYEDWFSEDGNRSGPIPK